MFARTGWSAPYPDRFVWVFGWNLAQDSEVKDITNVLDTAAKHGCNGAMVSFGLDTLCKKTPDFFRRLSEVQAACERNKIELIPALFSVGYGSAALAHDRNLAEGVLVQDAPFMVKGTQADFIAESKELMPNGAFEDYKGNKFSGFNFHDQPGEISFVDEQVKHSGKASLRLENFTANQYGHARVMQDLKLRAHRSYRVTLWAKTEGLKPVSAFQISVYAGNRSLAPRTFKLPSTTDWQKVSFIFNSLDKESVKIYAGLWGGKEGKLWLDDWSVEEVGPMNVLHRPGTPVTVRSADGNGDGSSPITYVEGKDYAPLVDPNYSPNRVDRPAIPLKLLPGSRIQDGQKLRVSWYHTEVVHDGQITVCMAEPALYEIFDHEAKLLAEKLHPKRIMLNMDEIRMGGTCRACAGRPMGELLGECITKQAEALHRYSPGAQIYIWSDMLDPHHNAHGDYYLVEGNYTNSWLHIPKDLTIAVWGGAPREKSLKFFAEQGFKTLVACYYDADDLKEVKAWMDLARTTPKVQGFMYTPWQKKYELLPEFLELIRERN